MSNKLWILLPVLLIASSAVLPAAATNTIAYIKSGDIAPYNAALDNFKKTVSREKQVIFAEIPLDADIDKAVTVAPPALILAIGSKAAERATKATKDIPVVFSMLMTPEFTTANVTGVTMDVSYVSIFSTLKRLIPRARKIGVIYDPKKTKKLVDRIISDARQADMELISYSVTSVEDVYGAVRTISPRVDALLMIPDSTVYTPKSTEDMLLHTLREGTPVIGLSASYVKAGALFTLSCNYDDIGRQSGHVALRIIDGAAPASIPAESPQKYEISINLISAERLGITIPNDILKEAGNVYK